MLLLHAGLVETRLLGRLDLFGVDFAELVPRRPLTPFEGDETVDDEIHVRVVGVLRPVVAVTDGTLDLLKLLLR